MSRLPTPLEVLKGFRQMIGAVVFALALALAFSTVAQFLFLVGAVALIWFHHWIIGGVLIGILIIVRSIGKSLRF